MTTRDTMPKPPTALRKRPTEGVAVRRALRNGSGQPLATSLRTDMEARLGGGTPAPPSSEFHALEAHADRLAGTARVGGPSADFSSVRLHSDAGTGRAVRSLGAQAFTIGEHIYADPNRLSASGGHDLLAHELGHVLQQREIGRAIVQPRLLATGTDADIQRFIVLAQAAMGEQLTLDPTTHEITPSGSLATPGTSPAFAQAMHRIMDDATQDAEAHFGQAQPRVAVGAFPTPDDMTGSTEQRIDMDDVEAIETGAPGNGLGKLAHELTENYTAHAAAPVAGVNQFPAAHDAGLSAESDVAEDTVGPGRRVAGVDTPDVGNAFTRIQDFETYYLVFTLTRNNATADFAVSNAHQAPRVNILTNTIDHFVTGSAALPVPAPPEIAAAAAAVAGDPTATVRIEGFADTTGTVAGNIILSNNRAGTVSAALQAAGVDAGRIHAVGRGQDAPVAGNDTEANRALNRRVTIIVDRPGP